MTTCDLIDHARTEADARLRRPRVGFLGVGWIGRNRLEAIARSNQVEIAGIADPAEKYREQAAQLAPKAAVVSNFEELLEVGLNGVVVATPSALHAAQAVAALERGLAVFCQKPLGRTAAETTTVIHAARRADLLLGVDLSYRFIPVVRKVRELVRSGELGRVYAAELIFHNAYGPDKAWFYDYNLSGGGCVIDLGIHLVDLALWILDFSDVTQVTSRLFSQGSRLTGSVRTVEDFAVATLDLSSGTAVQIGCSWKLPAGRDAVISGTFYGTTGGATFYNVNGSFYEFAAERFHGTQREALGQSGEGWGGRAAVDWATRLANGEKYDRNLEGLAAVAKTLDHIYER